MTNDFQHTDNSIQQKFENYAPAPPAHVWEGVQAGLAAQPKPAFYLTYGKQIAVAASILLLASLGIWWLLPEADNTVEGIDDTEVSTIGQNQTNQNAGNMVAEDAEADKEDLAAETELTTEDENAILSDSREDAFVSEANNQSNVEVENTDAIIGREAGPTSTNIETAETSSQTPALVGNDLSEEQQIHSLAAMSVALQNQTGQSANYNASDPPVLPAQNSMAKSSKWSQGVYFTPEYMLTNFDSVELLPAYSLNYEPTYHISNHLFIRFGLGLSYNRDRGFANIDYKRNEVVGTYEDVYDITFDSIDGDVIPTYHTKTTDIWDSVRHLQISEVTNKYLYLQTPVLLGYYKKNTKFNWFVYGGPAINVLVSKWIDEPEVNGDVDLITLENKLPERSPYFLQLWVGAGIEYKIGRQTAIAFEPNYRYYFNNVYKEDLYKSSLSSFSLRIGVVFTMK